MVTPLQPGAVVFNRYTLHSELGAGGMGVVWRAKDSLLDRMVALKFVPPAVASDPAAINLLRAEAAKAVTLSHPNIVRVFDLQTDGQLFGISMEFVEGENLAGLLHRQPAKAFNPADIADWVRQICEGLDHAHEWCGLVHRDIKPANLILSRENVIKIADFGIAAPLAESMTRLSRMGDSSGTPVYMSPQQMLGLPPTASDDIYALGATLYELLSGRPPFYRGDLFQQVRSIVPPSIVARRGELGIQLGPIAEHWEAVIARCLAKDPAQRPPSARDVARRLLGEQVLYNRPPPGKPVIGNDVAAGPTPTAQAAAAGRAAVPPPLPPSLRPQTPPPLPAAPFHGATAAPAAERSGAGFPVMGVVVGGLLAVCFLGALVRGLWPAKPSVTVAPQAAPRAVPPPVVPSAPPKAAPAAPVAPPGPPPPVPAGARVLNFAASSAVVDRSGMVLLLDTTAGRLGRWAPGKPDAFDSIELRGSPERLLYAMELDRLYLVYGDGAVTKVETPARPDAKEQDYLRPQDRLAGAAVAGRMFVAVISDNSWTKHRVFGPEGAQYAEREMCYGFKSAFWSQSRGRLYFVWEWMSPRDLCYEEISSMGKIGVTKDSPYHGEAGIDGKVLESGQERVLALSSGWFVDPASLKKLATCDQRLLGITRVTHGWFAVQHSGTRFALETDPLPKTTTVLRLGDDYQITARAVFDGTAVAILPAEDHARLITCAGRRTFVFELDNELIPMAAAAPAAPKPGP